MKIKGKLHRITNLQQFVASYLSTDGHPTQGFTNWGSARVYLAIDMGGGFPAGFLPALSIKMDANGQGEFTFTPFALLPHYRARIIVFNMTTLPGSPLPILAPVYRSESFKISAVSNTMRHIFIFQETTPTNLGVSQQALNALLPAIRNNIPLDILRAFIRSNRISIHAERSGGEIDFSAYVNGSTSHDLNRVIEVKAGEIDIDLPGPDLITGLCFDKDSVEAQIRNQMRGLSDQISQRLLNEFDQLAPGAAALVTVSSWRTRHVQTDTINMPGLPLATPIYTVVPDAAFGIPRRLY